MAPSADDRIQALEQELAELKVKTGLDDELPVSRRGFIRSGVATISLGSLSGPGVEPAIEIPDDIDGATDAEGFIAAPRYIGPLSARPDPNGEFFAGKTGVFVYKTDGSGAGDGEEYWISVQQGRTSSGWSELPVPNDNPQTQIDELVTTDFNSWINHTFARPNAPDDKNWEYTSADISKDGPELQLASSTALIAKQRGNYPAGSEAIPGVAWRVTAEPTGGECFAGYFDDSDDDNVPEDGIGFGSDSTSDFAFIAKNGTLHRIRETDWNGADIDSRPYNVHYPRISRFPHLYYGGGAIRWRVVDHKDTPEPVLKTIHTETPESLSDDAGAPFNSGPPLAQPNLPPAFTSNSLAGANLRANASHYNLGDTHAEKRVNGEHFAGVDAGTSGWTPLIAWRKRSGWEAVNVEPLRVLVSAETNDAKLELQLGATLDANASFGLPTHTDTDESAVEVDTSGGLSSNGQRRWPGYAAAGQGASSGGLTPTDLEFNLPSADVVVLAAQGVGGTASLSGAIAWEEYF